MRTGTFILMTMLLNGQIVHCQTSLQLDCRIKESFTVHKLFKKSERLFFNRECQLVKKIYNGKLTTAKVFHTKNVDSVCYSDNSIQVFHRDSLGRLSKRIFENRVDKVVEVFEYDTLNRPQSVTVTSNNALKVITYFYESERSIWHSRQRVQQFSGHTEEIETLRDSLGNPTLVNHFFFRENGDRVLDNRQVGGFDCSPCRYLYDRNGNWVRKYLMLDNGKERLYATRKLTYFD